MLVLTRKLNEEITIGDNIKVTVLQIKGNSIRLGIDAPKDVRIVRGELPIKQETHTANMTVVLSDARDDRGVELDVVPFERSDRRSKGHNSNRFSQSNGNAKPQSIQFKERLPESLQRTRLQQIVNEIANK